MMDIRYLVRELYDLSLQRKGNSIHLMIKDPISHFFSEVHARAVLFQQINRAKALLMVLKSFGTDTVKRPLAGVSKWCVSQVMPKRDGLHQVLIETQCLSNCPGILQDFKRMSHSCPVVVSVRRQKYLRLVF